MELRLLSDRAFYEEFDIIVDEISIRYASGDFEGKEKEQVEQHFLRTPERQNKVRVMSELLHHSATARGETPAVETPAVETPVRVTPAEDRGFFARLGRLLRTRTLIPAWATVAMVIIVVGVAFLVSPDGEKTYTFSLASTQVERASDDASDLKPVQIPPGTTEVHIQLLLSPPEAPPGSYRAEFVAPARDLRVLSYDARSVVVAVPAANLKPDRYAIRLYAVSPDGREERVPGSYIFRVG